MIFHYFDRLHMPIVYRTKDNKAVQTAILYGEPEQSEQCGQMETMTSTSMEADHEEAEEKGNWTVIKSRRMIRWGIMAAGSRRACAAKTDREGSVRESKSG